MVPSCPAGPRAGLRGRPIWASRILQHAQFGEIGRVSQSLGLGLLARCDTCRIKRPTRRAGAIRRHEVEASNEARIAFARARSVSSVALRTFAWARSVSSVAVRTFAWERSVLSVAVRTFAWDRSVS